MHSRDEYYKILGVPVSATLDEVKAAFREKAKKIHPDVNDKATAHEEFVALSDAFNKICFHKENPVINNSSSTGFKRGFSDYRKYGNSGGYDRYYRQYYHQKKQKNKKEFAKLHVIENIYMLFLVLLGIGLVFSPIFNYEMIHDDKPQYIATSAAGVILGIIFVVFGGLSIRLKSS